MRAAVSTSHPQSELSTPPPKVRFVDALSSPADDGLNGGRHHSMDRDLLASGAVWSFATPFTIFASKGCLLVYFLVQVFTTLSAIGFPLAHDGKEVDHGTCDTHGVSEFFTIFCICGVVVCITLPLWGKAFFQHMLLALQSGLQLFSEPYDREYTITLGVAVVVQYGVSLYGLHIATGGHDDVTQAELCDKGPFRVVWFCAMTIVLASSTMFGLHALHYHWMSRQRRRALESQTIVIY